MKFWLHQDTGPRDQQEDAIHAHESGIAIVCDGMGGHQAGDVASAMALETFVDALEEGCEPIEALEEAVASLRAASYERPEVRGMGTTLTALMVDETHGEAQVVHVGDSRLYHLPSPFEGAAAMQLTEDHGYGNMLARFLPDEAHPDLFKVDVVSGDRLMLCSDGISDVLDDEAIGEAMASEEPAEALVEMALEEGTFDNASAVVVEIEV